MTPLPLLVPFLLGLAPAGGGDADELPLELSLADERRPERIQEEGVPPPMPGELPERSSEGVMEYVFRNATLEIGLVYTAFDRDLRIEGDLGAYLRTGVRFAYGLSAHVTYRHFEFSNSDAPGKVEEDVSLRGLFVGGAYRYELTREFTILASLEAGLQRWESNRHAFSDDVGFAATGEVGATVRLINVLRFKAGLLVDLAKTDFHRSSSHWNRSVSCLVGFELGL